jgi:hypothetical protein
VKQKQALLRSNLPRDIRLILRADSISSAAIEIGSRERIACCSFLALSRYR